MPVRRRFHSLYPRIEPDVHAVTAQNASQLPGNGGVLTADELRARLDQGHFSTEPGIDLGELAADRTAAKNDQ